MPLRRVEYTQSRWRGCHPNKPGDAALLQGIHNGYSPNGAVIVKRPGFQKMGTAIQPTTNLQSQAAGCFLTTAGTAHNFYVAAGEIYDDATGALAFARRITTANLTSAGITLKNTGLVYWVEYNGQVVFNDGTNQPFMWDGTSGGGLTLLSNAPSTCIGRPTVYYGKLFFIKSGNTLVWSEENDATTGYEAGGYNNAWDVRQTSGEPIKAIVGTNDALYYFRPGGIGRISGAVTPDFASTGTDDGVSTVYGSIALLGPEKIDNHTIAFSDQFGRPCLLQGGQVVPLYERCLDSTQLAGVRHQETPFTAVPEVGLVSASSAAGCWVGFHPGYQIVLFGRADSTSTYLLAFSTTTWEFQGWWWTDFSNDGNEDQWRAAGPGYDTTNGALEPLLFLVPNDTTYGKIARIAHQNHDKQDGAWDVSAFPASSTFISFAVYAHAVPDRTSTTNHYFTEIEVTFAAASDGTLGVRYFTSDLTTWTTAQSVATTSPDNRVRVGINGFGRWCMVWLAPAYDDDDVDHNFRLESIRVTGYLADREGASKSR